MKTAIVTGSCGLIGSEAVNFLLERDYSIIGIDNNMRASFFGPSGSTEETRKLLCQSPRYYHNHMDIRNEKDIQKLFSEVTHTDLIIHTAAQPSHDWAASDPATDFSINAVGTLNLLEACRKFTPQATFIFTSTNKVYGDSPNKLAFKETATRYVPWSTDSIDESMSVDQSTHSVFGCSKLAADVLCQEYGRYFGLRTGIFRGGCLTGPNHAGTQLHGFLSHLVKCIVHDEDYTIFGYKGKQVRDNIHAYDLVNAFWHFHQDPKPGQVYNIGGGVDNTCSILEAISLINEINGSNWDYYTLDPTNRVGDHIWYVSDLKRFKRDYPDWKMQYGLRETLSQMVLIEQQKRDRLK